jgi:hypothetical protein
MAIWAAIAAAAAGAVVSAGASYAVAAATRPKTPDLASSSKELSNVNAELLPIRRALEAAAQQGSKVTIQNYPAHKQTGQYIQVLKGKKSDPNWEKSIALGAHGNLGGAIDSLFRKKKQYEYIPYNAEDWAEGGKYAGQKPAGPIVTRTVDVPAGPKEFDFTGYGAADADAAVARQMAQVTLDIQQKYGVDLAKAQAEQAKLADPEGYAAREKMNELIQGQINRTPDRSIATELDRQVGEQLSAGRGLTGDSSQMLDEAVREALAQRGGPSSVGADWADPLTMGFAGEARRAAGTDKALSWLGSGMTPQDADYRENQQNMSNLSALVNGRTPQSQFSSLSAPGAAPLTMGQPLSQMPNNAHAGASNAINQYNAEVNQATNTVNPWMAGLSGLLSVGNTWASAKGAKGT